MARKPLRERKEQAQAARERVRSGAYREQTNSSPSLRKPLRQAQEIQTGGVSESAGARSMQERRMQQEEPISRQDAKTIANNAKLGLNVQQSKPFQQQPVSDKLLRSNQDVRSVAVPKARNPIAAGLEQIQHGMQSAVQFQQRPTTEVPSTGNRTVDSLLRGTGEFLPGLATGQSEAQALGTISRGVQSVIGKAAPKVPSVLARTAGHAAAAGIENAYVGAASGQTSGKQVGENLAIGAALPVAGAAIKQGVKQAVKPLQRYASKTAENIINKYLVRASETTPTPLGLPQGRTRGNVNTAQTPGVVTTPYTFKLPLGDEYGLANRAAAAEDLQTINNEIRQLNSRYEAAVNEEYKYLKDTAKQGIKQGEIIFDPNDVTGDTVIARTGRKSNNEKWYRDFYAEKGRAPSNKEMYDLARQRVENGFVVDEVGNMAPSWLDENEYHDTMEALTQVRDNLNKSLNKAESTQVLTDATLKQNEPSFKRSQAGGPKPAVNRKQAQRVQKPQASPNVEPSATVRKPLISATSEPARAVEQQQGIRANFGTQVESGRYSPELQRRIDEVDQTYDIAHNVDTVDRANKTVSNLNQAEGDFLSNRFLNSGDNAQHTALGYRLMDEFDTLGQYDKAIAISEKLAKDLTKQGQGVQAASIIKRLSPEGQLMALTRKAEANGIKLTPKDRADFREAAIAAQQNAKPEMRNNAVQDVLDKLEAGEKPTADDLTLLQTTLERAKKFVGEQEPKTAKQETPKTPKPIRKRDIALEKLDKAAEAAQARINARRGIGFIPTKGNEMIDYGIIMARDLARKAVNSADYVEYAVKQWGEDFRPIAGKIYNIARNRMGQFKNELAPDKVKSAEEVVEQWAKKTPTSTKDLAKVRELAEAVSKLEGKKGKEADVAMQQIMNKYEKSSVWDKLQAIRYMMMLGNTATQGINATSGLAMAGLKNTNDVLGAMFEGLLSPLLRNKRTTSAFGLNPLAYVADLAKNLKVGSSANWKGVNPSGLHSINELKGLAFKSKYNPFGIAERTLRSVAGGADYAVYKTQFNNEIAKQARLAAGRQKLTGAARDKFIRDFKAKPSEDALEIADRVGKETTFQQSNSFGDVAANAVSSLGSKGKTGKVLEQGVRAVSPFIRTPLNIAETGVNMTPVGVIRGIGELIAAKTPAEQRKAINTFGLGVTGTGLGALGYYLSKVGIITGANDSGDKNLDAVREQAGRGAYRFNQDGLLRYLNKIYTGEGRKAAEDAAKYQEGDKTFDYNKLQPITFPVTLGAGFQQGQAKGGIAKGAEQAGTQGFGSLLGMSSLKGIQDVITPQMSGAQGEKQLGVLNRFVESYLKSFSPSLLAQEARRQDTTQRQTAFNKGLKQDLGDYYKSRIPGLSQTLPAKMTTLGQEKTNTPGVVGQYLNPYRSEVQNFNKAAQIVADLIDRTGNDTIAPSPPEKYVTGTEAATGKKEVRKDIPPQRYAQLQQDIGAEVTKRIIEMDTNSPDDVKADRIKIIIEDTKKKYLNRLRPELGLRVAK